MMLNSSPCTPPVVQPLDPPQAVIWTRRAVLHQINQHHQNLAVITHLTLLVETHQLQVLVRPLYQWNHLPVQAVAIDVPGAHPNIHFSIHHAVTVSPQGSTATDVVAPSTQHATSVAPAHCAWVALQSNAEPAVISSAPRLASTATGHADLAT